MLVAAVKVASAEKQRLRLRALCEGVAERHHGCDDTRHRQLAVSVIGNAREDLLDGVLARVK
ncbi:MAG: hypothetical protein DMF49_02265 [Acidobacteria bacterium]|nr:MAG: hypothetical protein DMF49_02265 [Acidobacteriota bacterium]